MIDSGVMHLDEANFVFGDPFVRVSAYDDEDREVSRKVLKYWTNFAKTG